jgi:hypothetical protein
LQVTPTSQPAGEYVDLVIVLTADVPTTQPTEATEESVPNAAQSLETAAPATVPAP